MQAERLRELAVQAGLPTALDYHQKRYEKFAELLIKECASQENNIKTYLLDEDTLAKLKALHRALHGGTDRERDFGHKLWLLCNDIEQCEVTNTI